MKLQLDKCEFLKKEVAYLGHIIGGNGVKPDPKKLNAVKEFPHPQEVKNIRQFLGLAGYYRRFIPKFSKNILNGRDLRILKGHFQHRHPADNADSRSKKIV